MLREFDDCKKQNYTVQINKDNDINNLEKEKRYIEDKIIEAQTKIKYLENKINDNDKKFIELKDSLNSQISHQLNI